MKRTIKLNSENLSKIIKESVNRVLTEDNNNRELANQVAREILGADSFEEFYKKTGFMVGSKDYYLMSEYFKRLAELKQQQTNYKNEDKIYKTVSNLFEDLKRYKSSINESLKSKILRDLYAKNPLPRGLSHGLYYDNLWFDLYNITDDMIEGVYNSKEEANLTPRTPYITFPTTGVTVVFNDKIKELDAPNEKKFKERSRNKDRWWWDEYYYSKNPGYNDYRTNYRGWIDDIEKGDKPYLDSYSPETRLHSTPSFIKQYRYQAAKDWYNKRRGQ